MSNQVTLTQNASTAMLFDGNTFEQAQRAANLFANSNLVPAHFKGKVADCFIGMMIATRMNEDPLTVMQNMYMVNGRPGWSTSYMISRANASGVFKGRITWASEGAGDSLSVTASATLADTGEQVSASASMAMAKAEDWTRNAKYKSMPEHMLRWRSAAMLIRLYAPEVMLGYQTQEELETLPIKDITPVANDAIDSLVAKIEAEKAAEVPAEPEHAEQPAEQVAFDIAAQNLKTQAGIKEAVKGLCILLDATPPEDRGGVFLMNGGSVIASAASRAGLGNLRERFETLGIVLPKE